MDYPIIIESGKNNYSAYCPDLPGCIAAGDTIAEVKQLMKEGIEMHIRGMKEDGEEIPVPSQIALVSV